MKASNTSSSTRERILGTAARLFFTQGYHATGINQIIAEAAVAKASFYDHFSSKEILARAYLEHRSTQWRERLASLTTSLHRPADRILALFALLLEDVQQGNYRGCPFLNMATEFPAIDAPIREQIRRQKMMLRDFFHTQVQETLGPTHPTHDMVQRANTIYLLYEAALIESVTFSDYWPVDAARASVEQILAA